MFPEGSNSSPGDQKKAAIHYNDVLNELRATI